MAALSAVIWTPISLDALPDAKDVCYCRLIAVRQHAAEVTLFWLPTCTFISQMCCDRQTYCNVNMEVEFDGIKRAIALVY